MSTRPRILVTGATGNIGREVVAQLYGERRWTRRQKRSGGWRRVSNALRSVHARVEECIEKSGVRWTFLRPGPFALNCLNWWAPQIRNGEIVRWFHGAAETAVVHERDIAAVAVCALGDKRHDRGDYVLTGPESLTQREQLAIIGDTIGRTLVFDEVSPETARQDVLAKWPAQVADMLLSAYAAAVDNDGLGDRARRGGWLVRGVVRARPGKARGAAGSRPSARAPRRPGPRRWGPCLRTWHRCRRPHNSPL